MTLWLLALSVLSTARCSLDTLVLCAPHALRMAPRVLEREDTIFDDDYRVYSAKALEKKVPATWLVNGTLLCRLAKEHNDTLSELTRRRKKLAPDRLSWASCCSGSEGLYFVMEAIAHAWPWFKPEHLWSCENDKDKQEWIKGVTETERSPSDDDRTRACLFSDISTICGDRAYCVTHDQECRVLQPDVLCLGTSCKDLSKQSKSFYKPKERMTLHEASSTGHSADTFWAFIEFIDARKPLIVVYENVDSMDDEQSDQKSHVATNTELLMTELHNRGYEGQKFIPDALVFGLPSRRRRYYVVFYLTTPSTRVTFVQRPFMRLFKTLRQMVTCCMRTPCCLSELLSLSDKEDIEGLLHDREAVGTRAGAQYQVDWPDVHYKRYAAAGMRWGGYADLDRTDFGPFWKTMLPRERCALLYDVTIRPKRFVRDMSQTIDRIPVSVDGPKNDGPHSAPAQLPTQIVFIDPRACANWPEGVDKTPRLMTANESLMCMGWPVALRPELCSRTKENVKQSLAGNAMATPVLLSMVMSAIAALDWREDTVDVGVGADDEDAVGWGPSELGELEDNALSAFKCLGAPPQAPEVAYCPKSKRPKRRRIAIDGR